MSSVPYAFLRGEYVPLSEAKVNIMTHALHYGTGVFEGIRGNWNAKKQTIYIFRLREHYERLLRGCRMLMINLPLLPGGALPDNGRASGEVRLQ